MRSLPFRIRLFFIPILRPLERRRVHGYYSVEALELMKSTNECDIDKAVIVSEQGRTRGNKFNLDKFRFRRGR